MYPPVIPPPARLPYTGINLVLEVVLAAALIIGGMLVMRLASSRRSKTKV